MPDAVPDIIYRHIQNSTDSAMVILYTIFLYLWVFGGIASVIGGLTAIIVRHFRS